jgi:CO/xanthine dehydrogenase Mo-binding subunit
MPDMAHAKVMFARRPHARVLSMDLSAAVAVPGVLSIFTGADVPVNEYGLVLFDAPVMVTPLHLVARSSDHAPLPFDGVVRHVGEKLAFIVAETEQIAARRMKICR